MNEGRTVFAQLMDFVPRSEFRACVDRYDGNHRVRTFSCWDQFLCMAFAQLTYRESLRDIEACLRAMEGRLYHMGIRGQISRNTLAVANEKRDWRIYHDLALVLIGQARALYGADAFSSELKHAVYALDATTIALCLSVFPWAYAQTGKAGVKLNTLLDLQGNIPAFAHISRANVHDVHFLDRIIPEPGALYIMDRGYMDFLRLRRFDEAHALFIVRTRKDLGFRRVYSRAVDRSTGLLCDQTIRLTNWRTGARYRAQLRRVRRLDLLTGKALTVVTNCFTLPALTVTDLYRCRWQIELFFRWIKQHLRIKRFYGITANAVKTQIWIAISVYVLVAIARHQLGIERELYTILQILSLTLFEKVPLAQALSGDAYILKETDNRNQLQLFNF